MSCRIVRPCAEPSINVRSRFRRVSSRFALTTHQIAVLLYDGGRDWKYSHAAVFARNSRSWSGSSFAAWRCS